MVLPARTVLNAFLLEISGVLMSSLIPFHKPKLNMYVQLVFETQLVSNSINPTSEYSTHVNWVHIFDLGMLSSLSYQFIF